MAWVQVDTSTWDIFSGLEIRLAEYCPAIKEVHIICVYTGVDGIPNVSTLFRVPNEYIPKSILVGIGFHTYENTVTAPIKFSFPTVRKGNEIYMAYGENRVGYRHRVDIRYTVE